MAAASRRDDPAGPEPGGMDPHGGGAGSSVARQSRACLDRQQFGSRYNGAVRLGSHGFAGDVLESGGSVPVARAEPADGAVPHRSTRA